MNSAWSGLPMGSGFCLGFATLWIICIDGSLKQASPGREQRASSSLSFPLSVPTRTTASGCVQSGEIPQWKNKWAVSCSYMDSVTYHKAISCFGASSSSSCSHTPYLPPPAVISAAVWLNKLFISAVSNVLIWEHEIKNICLLVFVVRIKWDSACRKLTKGLVTVNSHCEWQQLSLYCCYHHRHHRHYYHDHYHPIVITIIITESNNFPVKKRRYHHPHFTGEEIENERKTKTLW